VTANRLGILLVTKEYGHMNQSEEHTRMQRYWQAGKRRFLIARGKEMPWEKIMELTCALIPLTGQVWEEL
jgi:hypothetical protein